MQDSRTFAAGDTGSLTMEKKGSKTKSLRIAVDKFNEEIDMFATVQDKEFSQRRDSKRRRKEEINNDKRLKLYRKLYVPAVGCLLGGFVLSIGGTVRGLSEKTFLWRHREVFCILGPIILTIGIGLLLLSVALVTNRIEKVTRLVALRKSLKSNSSQNMLASLKSSMDSTNKICHSIEDLDELEQSFTYLSVSERTPKRKLSSSNSQVSFSDEIHIHEIKQDLQQTTETKWQGKIASTSPIYSEEPIDTRLPYKRGSISFRLLEGIIKAQRCKKNGHRTLAKYKDQLHLKPTGSSNEESLLLCKESSHYNTSMSNTETTASTAVKESRILTHIHSQADENIAFCINDQPSGDGDSVTQIQHTIATSTQRPRGPTITNDVKEHTGQGIPNQGHSPCTLPQQNSCSKHPGYGSDQISTCTEITILIHPPNTAEN